MTTKKVANNSLLRVDFKAGQLPAGPAGAAARQDLRDPQARPDPRAR